MSRIGPDAKKRQKTRQTGDKRSGLPYSSGQIRNSWINEFRAAPDLRLGAPMEIYP